MIIDISDAYVNIKKYGYGRIDTLFKLKYFRKATKDLYFEKGVNVVYYEDVMLYVSHKIFEEDGIYYYRYRNDRGDQAITYPVQLMMTDEYLQFCIDCSGNDLDVIKNSKYFHTVKLNNLRLVSDHYYVKIDGFNDIRRFPDMEKLDLLIKIMNDSRGMIKCELPGIKLFRDDKNISVDQTLYTNTNVLELLKDCAEKMDEFKKIKSTYNLMDLFK